MELKYRIIFSALHERNNSVKSGICNLVESNISNATDFPRFESVIIFSISLYAKVDFPVPKEPVRKKIGNNLELLFSIFEYISFLTVFIFSFFTTSKFLFII